VFISNGRQVLSGFWDSTMKLRDIATGKEIAQFISFTDGEWLVVTSDGYYDASPNGDKYLNVRVGNNVYGIGQYRSTHAHGGWFFGDWAGIPDTCVQPIGTTTLRLTGTTTLVSGSFAPSLAVRVLPLNRMDHGVILASGGMTLPFPKT
jgi:hypothetical protein